MTKEEKATWKYISNKIADSIDCRRDADMQLIGAYGEQEFLKGLLLGWKMRVNNFSRAKLIFDWWCQQNEKEAAREARKK